ncbi:hypothetical protein H4R34_003919 [Dimargaris verticillata]|uniref:Nucleolar protein 12 n=1 Tax=Dimargaris verticillata TaxID=2761393 RepID=A0A9W8EBL2_9FUNG|nr:hypothetical protein H4R34_003919 [Dimargaris verticillata]
MDNLELLTAGAKIYAKKRKFQKNQVEEITFDSDSLKGYLKSFKNRKKDRQKRAEVNRKKQIKLDRKERQKEKKEQLQQQYAEAVAAQRAYYGIDDPNSTTDGEGDPDGENNRVGKVDEQDVAEYRAKDTLTTVTVVSEFDPHSTDPYDDLNLSKPTSSVIGDVLLTVFAPCFSSRSEPSDAKDTPPSKPRSKRRGPCYQAKQRHRPKPKSKPATRR